MIVYHAKELESAPPRAHPWSRAISDKRQIYIDFKSNPRAIRNTLEDFKPFEKYDFAQRFYSLLEWLNGQHSSFESNDCAFKGKHKNETDPQFKYPFKCYGRVMILYRDIIENTQSKSIEWLMSNLKSSLQILKPGFKTGAIGLSKMETVYMELDDCPKMGGLGKQINISLFAYGKNERKCFEGMAVLIDCLDSALKGVNKKLKNEGRE